jgi:serine/threonine-protein kinase HipA
MLRDAYVFVNIDGIEVPAARIQHRREKGGDRFYFVYAKSYLARKDAFSIDPRQLPIGDQVKLLNALPLALEDNGPDAFGRHLYEQLHGGVPESPLDYLLDNGLHGIGGLALSSSLSPPTKSLLPTLESLDELSEAYASLAGKRKLSPKMATLLNAGTSLPGARPKALLEEGGEQWIVKFNKPEDAFNIAIAEHATMACAANQFRCAQSRVENIDGNYIYLTKRFDRDNLKRTHFLSAYTLMGANNVREETFHSDYGYPAMAQLIKQVSSEPVADRKELYTRMVLNVLVGNRDDHLKNHGFLKLAGVSRYRLSPAYDIVPAAYGSVQAIGVGSYGATATMENMLSCSNMFGVEPTEAHQVFSDVSETVMDIVRMADDLGMSEDELSLMKDGMFVICDKELVSVARTSPSYSPSMG